MSSTPPPSSDGPVIAPRHRPNLTDLNKNSIEADLWDLDDDLPASAQKPVFTPEPRRNAVPIPRESFKYSDSQEGDASQSAESADSLLAIGAKKPQALRPNKDRLIARAKDDLADLEDLVESPVAPVSAPAEPVTSPAEPAVIHVAPAEVVVEETAENEAPSPVIQEESAPAPQEKAAPASLLPKLNLSPVERIGLVALLVALLIGGGALTFRTFGRLPTEAKQVDSSSFPIKGKLVTIAAADTYWRAPVSDGAGSEIVRRGSVLVPVTTFKIKGGPAAIRILYRNSDGKVTGDVLTRAVKEGDELEVPGTAGFDDVGMHAAYRTGQTKPWRVEFYEAASANSASQDFKKIFEMRISIARR